MGYSIRISKRAAGVFLAGMAIVIATGLVESQRSHSQSTGANTPRASGADSKASQTTVELSPSQLNAVKIEPVGTYLFPVEKETVGNISFADDLSVQVFPPYQGKILRTFVDLGDKVQKAQPLYTIPQSRPDPGGVNPDQQLRQRSN